MRTSCFALLFAASAAHAEGLDGRLKKIADSKTITIAYRTDAVPFSFTDDKKQVLGFSVDLCKRVVNSIERQLKIQGLQTKWVPVTEGRLRANLLGGRIEVVLLVVGDLTKRQMTLVDDDVRLAA